MKFSFKKEKENLLLKSMCYMPKLVLFVIIITIIIVIIILLHGGLELTLMSLIAGATSRDELILFYLL